MRIIYLSRKVRLTLTFIFLLIGGLFCFIACQREEKTILEDSISLADPSNCPFSFKIIDNTVSFTTREDYDKALDYLNEVGDNKNNSWTEDDKFISMRSYYLSMNQEDKMPIKDQLFAAIINPQGELIIDDHLFRIDPINETIAVTVVGNSTNRNTSSLKNTESIEYSFEENVLDIVIDGAEPQAFEKGDYCDNRPIEYTMTLLSGQNIKCQCDYQKYGVYFALKAEITKVNSYLGRYEIYLQILGDEYRIKGEDYYHDIPVINEGGTDHNYYYRPYHASKKLKDYTFETAFWGKDNWPYPPDEQNIILYNECKY